MAKKKSNEDMNIDSNNAKTKFKTSGKNKPVNKPVKKTETKKGKKTRIIKIKLCIFFLVLVALGVSFIFQAPLEKWINYKYNGDAVGTNIDSSGLVVHFVDVGQADCIVVEFPTGENMIVDAGENKSELESKMIDYINSSVQFEDSKPKTFDYFVMTHYHSDHIGGADAIYDEYTVINCLYPDYTLLYADDDISKVMQTALDKTDAEGCSKVFFDADTSLTIGSATIEFYSPFYNATTAGNTNNQSPIMIITYQGRKIMLTGDADEDLEAEVLADVDESELDVDVLKVSHHGSKTSSSKEFLEAVKPEYAVISVGEGNKYKHPTKEALNRLSDVGVKTNNLYRTDLNGNIVASINSSGEIEIVSSFVNSTPVHISWIYICGLVLVVVVIVLFVPKGKQKNAVKLLSNSKK